MGPKPPDVLDRLLAWRPDALTVVLMAVLVVAGLAWMYWHQKRAD